MRHFFWIGCFCVFQILNDVVMGLYILLCRAILLVFFCFVFSGCSSQGQRGEILKRGVVSCFPPAKKGEDVVNCEASAVIFLNGVFWAASDKAIPDKSSVFRFRLNDSFDVSGVEVDTNSVLKQVRKIEDMSHSPDGSFVLVSTGFDRVKENSREWNNYNVLLYWKTSTPNDIKVVGSDDSEPINSLMVRKGILKALSEHGGKEVKYFKIEGEAVVPGNRILFGIREEGASYEDFEYKVKIVSVSYSFDTGLSLGADYKVMCDFSMKSHTRLRLPVGLSSIEYDRFHDRLMLLTSFEFSETDEGVGGYLWCLPMDGKKESLVLVKDKNGEPLVFAHKAEGVAVVSEDLFVIIHDDDRRLGRPIVTDSVRQFSRLPNEAAFTVVRLK